MDRFDDMQTFVRVVEAGSFTGAAERLKRAKSAVSRRVSELEERLGVRLFNRTTRRLSLTETGRAFYAHCVSILADLEEAELAVSAEYASLRGALRVAAPMSFGLLHLTPAINEFLRDHNELNLELDLNDRFVDLVEEGFDVAIRLGKLADSSLIARRLAPIRRITCANPIYLNRYGIPETPADLTHHVGLSYSNLPESVHWQYQSADGAARAVKVPIRMRANNGDVLLAAAIAGLGIIALPTFLVFDAIEQGKLQPVLSDYTLPQEAAYAVYPPGRHLSHRVRVFVNFLVERFGDKPYWERCLANHNPAQPKPKGAR